MSKDKREAVVSETAPETAPVQAEVLATVPVSNALTLLLDAAPSAFIARYGEELRETGQNLPSKEQINAMLAKMPEQYSEPLAALLRKTLGKKRGLHTDENMTNFPELRLFQGTGNDPNRPENTIPGQYYLTTKESVGKAFEGTLLAAWTGSTMWPAKEESARVPVCHSMDRQVGSTFGECKKCPNMPWRNGQQTLCGNDVVAFMLSKDLKDIVIVRFAKTSEPAGKQLLSYANRSDELYARWYTITSKTKVNAKDSTKRWFLFDVSPQEGESSMVPKEMWPFCEALSMSIDAAFIWPAKAQVYRQAEAAMAPADADEAAPTVSGSGSLGQWGGSENV